MKKNYVLDTNVLLHDPYAIFKFKDNNVILPIFVIEEIDTFKKDGNGKGRSARLLSRTLDKLREEKGSLSKKVPLEGGGTLRVIVPKKGVDFDITTSDVDGLILQTAIEVRDAEPDLQTILVTMDTNLRIRADVLGIRPETYESQRISSNKLDTNIHEIQITDAEVDSFYSEKQLPAPEGVHLNPNACVRFYGPADNSGSGVGRYDSNHGAILPLYSPEEVMGIRPRNLEQRFAIDLLMDDRIKLVTLVGKAGTGKTLLALAAALACTMDGGVYTRTLVSRPIMPLGRDIGYLPGTVEEKLNPWLQPIFDNLELLVGSKKGLSAQKLVSDGLIQVEPLTYIRGRSIPHQYLIIDEAQNLTPHEVKTIVTRSGEGTKIVLTGDPHQIDNPYVDSASNGLAIATDRFKGERIAGHIVLSKGERSELAELASNLL
jgi:PhoH-like ATPase